MTPKASEGWTIVHPSFIALCKRYILHTSGLGCFQKALHITSFCDIGNMTLITEAIDAKHKKIIGILWESRGVLNSNTQRALHPPIERIFIVQYSSYHTLSSNVSEITRRTRLPFIHTTEGGIQPKPQTLVAQWVMENGALICRWVTQ